MEKNRNQAGVFHVRKCAALLAAAILLAGVPGEAVYALHVEKHAAAEADPDTGAGAEWPVTEEALPDAFFESKASEKECVITLDAGEEGFFADEEGNLFRTWTVTGEKGEAAAVFAERLPVPSPDGDTAFAGWSLESGGIPLDPSWLLEGDCTLYALWDSAGEQDPGETVEEDGAGDPGERSEEFAVDLPESSVEGGEEPAEDLPESSVEGDGEPAEDLPESSVEGSGEPEEYLPESSVEGGAEPEKGDILENSAESTGEPAEYLPESSVEGSGEPAVDLPESSVEGIGEPAEYLPESSWESGGEPEEENLPESIGLPAEEPMEEQEPMDGRGGSAEEYLNGSSEPANGPVEDSEEGSPADIDGDAEEPAALDGEEPGTRDEMESGFRETEGSAYKDGEETASRKEEEPVLQDEEESEAVGAAGSAAAASGQKTGQETGSQNSQKTSRSDSNAAQPTGIAAQSTGSTARSTNLIVPAAGRLKMRFFSRTSLQKAKAALTRTAYVYNGRAKKPAVRVVYAGKTLRQGTDYSIRYSRNVKAGRAIVKIVGKGKYKGTLTRYFTIRKAARKLTLKASAAKVSAGGTMTVKAGGAKETSKYTYTSSNTAVAKVSSSGKVTAKTVGTVKITAAVPATANYRAGRKTVTIKVVPGATKKLTAKNQTKGFLLSWKKVQGANGYILYRNGKKIKTITKGSTLSYRDTAANTIGRKYTYKIVAKAATGTSTLSRSVSVIRRKTQTPAPASTSLEGFRVCLEAGHAASTLRAMKKGELAVIDMDGVSSSVISAAKKRGVRIYGYVNAGALEKQRRYYSKFEHLRIARYHGWDGEYWVDPTDSKWIDHLVEEAQKQKDAGATGVFLDNTDIYYMVLTGFDKEHGDLMRTPPSAARVYNALSKTVKTIRNSVGIVVMPNGGDIFVRKFEKENPGIIQAVIQEAVLYEDFERQPDSETGYLTNYLDWCKKRGMRTRGIEYTTSSSAMDQCRKYYKKHGWTNLYISEHTNLIGD